MARLTGKQSAVSEKESTAMVPDMETFLADLQSQTATTHPTVHGSVSELMQRMNEGALSGLAAAEQAIQLLHTFPRLCLQFNSFLPEGCLIYENGPDEGVNRSVTSGCRFKVLVAGQTASGNSTTTTTPSSASNTAVSSPAARSAAGATPSISNSDTVKSSLLASGGSSSPAVMCQTPSTLWMSGGSQLFIPVSNPSSPNAAAAPVVVAGLSAPPPTQQEAEMFLQIVRQRLTMAGQPELYDRFKNCIQQYLSSRRPDAERTARRCKQMFRQFPDLLLAFTRFLPTETRIKYSNEAACMLSAQFGWQPFVSANGEFQQQQQPNPATGLQKTNAAAPAGEMEGR